MNINFKLEVSFVKVLVRNQVFYNKLLNALFAFVFASYFLDQRSDFMAYTLCAKYVIKIFQTENMKIKKLLM